jgi:hypothetical protein
MARRAQGSVADCPFCSATLPQLAAECPECRFPLTMAAADVGFRAPNRPIAASGRPVGRPVPLAGLQAGAARDRFHRRRAHRMRLTAWLLGLTAILLLLAGVGALITASSPAAAGDREAQTNLLTALHRDTVDPGARHEVTITVRPGAEASARPDQVSVERADDLWFGASRSVSGRCFLLVSRVGDGAQRGGGTLGKDEPCTGAHVRTRFEQSEAKANAKP